MTMEKYNWIKAYYASQNDDGEHEVFVRQSEADRSVFFDADGHAYDIDELDFTQIPEEPSFMTEWNERMKKQNEEHERTQSQLREMLSSMDAKAIADHKAEIDEREYWRKLRGEIFASLRKDYHSDLDALNQTEFVINRLYKQDQEFFKDKENDQSQ